MNRLAFNSLSRKIYSVLLVFTLVSCSADNLENNIFTFPEFLTELGKITWTAPTQREDSTPLPTNEIETYKVYYGTTSGFYKKQIDLSDIINESAELPGFFPGTYYFVVTTVDIEGRESKYSQEFMVMF